MASPQPINHKGFKTTGEIIAGVVVLMLVIAGASWMIKKQARVVRPTPTSTPTWLYNLESSGSVEAVFQGLYLGKTAYYVRSRCCDNYNDLYNQSGDIICSPDGGITGNGDGKCSSAGKEFSRKGFKQIWNRPNI